MINFLVEVGVLDFALLLERVAALVDCSLRVLLGECGSGCPGEGQLGFRAVAWCGEFPMLQVGVYIQL
jgi:hypothetical protein